MAAATMPGMGARVIRAPGRMVLARISESNGKGAKMTFDEMVATVKFGTVAEGAELIGVLPSDLSDEAVGLFIVTIESRESNYNSCYFIELLSNGLFALPGIPDPRDYTESATLEPLLRILYRHIIDEEVGVLVFAASRMDDLDEACRLVQDKLGQTDGGIAGIVFSDLEPFDWESMDRDQRYDRARQYVRTELAMDSTGEMMRRLISA